MVFYNLPNWTGVTVDLRFAVAAKQWLDQQGIVYIAEQANLPSSGSTNYQVFFHRPEDAKKFCNRFIGILTYGGSLAA